MAAASGGEVVELFEQPGVLGMTYSVDSAPLPGSPR